MLLVILWVVLYINVPFTAFISALYRVIEWTLRFVFGTRRAREWL